MRFSKKFYAASEDYATFRKEVPAPYMRRSVTVDQLPEKAIFTVCGLGFYDLWINGKKMTKGLLAPYISNPDQILYYDSYDILPELRQGENVFALILGNGMLNCPGGEIWDFEKVVYRSAPKVAFAIQMDRTCIEADENVKCAPSPIRFDDIRVGEFYDANEEQDGWTLPGFDDSGWSAAIPAETPRGKAVLCKADPIRPREEIRPVAITKSSVGKVRFRDTLPVIPPLEDETGEGWLFDFGVNFAGVTQLKINGRKGQKITLQFGETLTEDGKLDLSGMTFLPERFNHRDQYVCRGGGEEIHTPAFTYHGFRYVLVFGLDDDQVSEDLLTYVVCASDLKVRAGFSCSDEIANKLWNAGIVSDLSNFYYFPTDCPHREKNGWTGDASLSAEQMTLVLDPERSYHEWLRNIRAVQAENGSLPGIVPTGGWGFDWGNGPAWDNVTVNVPYAVWKYRGDTDIIRENASMIVRYIEYIADRRDERGLIHIGLGDWCPVGRWDPAAPLEFTDTVIVLDYCRKASEMFRACGLRVQAAIADALYDELYATCRRLLIDTDTMTACGGCQTTQAMAIYYGLFTSAEKPEAFRVLVRMIDELGGHMDVGILGARVIFHVLSEYGRSDLAWQMINGTEYPSYGNWIARGATSLWEEFTPEGHDPSSLNHHFFGDILSWYIRWIAGIRVNPLGDGCDTADIAIQPVPQLDFASGWHELPIGRVATEWRRDGEGIVLNVTVPEGLKGHILPPAGMKFDDGQTRKKAANGEYRLIPCAVRDRNRMY